MAKGKKKKDLTSNDWDDVADLLEQHAEGIELGPDNLHTMAARLRAAEWIRSMVFKAHDKAREIEVEDITDRMMSEEE